MEVLPDTLESHQAVVFCGTAAGRRSGQLGAYYAGHGNRFWEVLFKTGLTPRCLEPQEFRDLLGYGIGLTDVAKEASGSDSQVGKHDYDVAGLRERVTRAAPRVLAFNGKQAAKVVLGRQTVEYGLQKGRIGLSQMFVLPSTSGAARGFWDESVWHDLAMFVKHRRPLPEPSNDSGGHVTADGGVSTGVANVTQRVTAADRRSGRIRVPQSAKSLFPDGPTKIHAVLRGLDIPSASWNPRDRKRSGVITALGGNRFRERVADDETLEIVVANGRYVLS